MATFFNQATLAFNGTVSNSNIVTGEILEVLSATKTAVSDRYTTDAPVTFLVSIVNSGTTPFTGLTLTDALGAYTMEGEELVPLTYVTDSVLVFANGVQQPTPTVTAGPPLVISGINVPAGGNVIVVYQARPNAFAPLDLEGEITNRVTITGGGLSTPVQAETDIFPESEADLSISKAVSPTTVTENGQLTYTFLLQNFGNTPATATDSIVVTDTFNPILDPITVTFNGTPWVEGVQYTYDSATGEFATIDGQITVPAATFTRDPETGEWSVSPGVSVLTVTGTV